MSLSLVDECDGYALQWRHNGRDSVSNHQPHNYLLNGLFRRRSKKTWKLRVTGLCAGNSPRTGEFPAQMASNAENVSISWRHHDTSSRAGLLPYTRYHIHYTHQHDVHVCITEMTSAFEHDLIITKYMFTVSSVYSHILYNSSLIHGPLGKMDELSLSNSFMMHFLDEYLYSDCWLTENAN